MFDYKLSACEFQFRCCHSTTPWLRKTRFKNYPEISKREILIFTLIHSNWMKTFESEIKYKIIAKNAMTTDTSELTINVLLMKSRFPHNNTKEGFIFFLPWRYGFSWSTTHPPCFPLRKLTKNAVTHPPPMREVIIKQPLLDNVLNMLLGGISFQKLWFASLLTLLSLLLLSSSFSLFISVYSFPHR